MKHVTLIFLRREGQILLAMKKRGFGAGRWNGAGGKLEPGETRDTAAIRECREEIGVTPKDLTLVAEMEFYDYPDIHMYTHVYTATDWEGEPAETEEMRPQWFNLDAIPYADMWPDDTMWLPLLIEGKRFKGVFKYGPNDTIIEHTLTEVEAL